MSRLVVAPAARDDLDRIWDYIAVENSAPLAADRLIESIYAKCTLLASQPLMAEQCREFEHLVPGLRRSIVGNYIIYYTPIENGVCVGHVAHGGMDQDAFLRRWFGTDETSDE